MRDLCEVLLENGATVDLASSAGVTPLMVASYHGYESVVRVLLAHNASPTIRGKFLFCFLLFCLKI